MQCTKDIGSAYYINAVVLENNCNGRQLSYPLVDHKENSKILCNVCYICVFMPRFFCCLEFFVVLLNVEHEKAKTFLDFCSVSISFSYIVNHSSCSVQVKTWWDLHCKKLFCSKLKHIGNCFGG